MPFIRRKRTAVAESVFGSTEFEHEFYVRAREVQKGDVIVPVEQLPDEILRDLAKSYPKEFSKAALERGLLELEDEDDEDELPADDDEDELEDVFTERQEAFMLLNAEKAIAAVQAAANDPELLAEYAEAESAKEKPRKTVLEALQAALEAK